MHFQNNLFGSQLLIEIYDKNIDSKEFNDIITDILICCKIFQGKYSRFESDSLVSALNRDKKVQVDKDFQQMFWLCKKYYEYSEHYFNPLVNISSYGYNKDYSIGEFEKQLVKVDSDLDKVNLEDDWLMLGEDVNLDLGGIGKGYAIQKIRKKLEDRGVRDYLVDLGGDILCKNTEKPFWIVGIENPVDNSTIGSLQLADMAVTCSGTYRRKWSLEGVEFNHILNPIDNKFEENIVSVILIHEDIIFADCIATALVAMGLEKAIQFTKEKGLEVIIIDKSLRFYISKGVAKDYSLQLFKQFELFEF
ncbi:MAG: FAD:protein FMN transferase [Candidatus Absconditabacteria bacterium]